MFPASRWLGTYPGKVSTGAGHQVVEWAKAAVWQLEQAVEVIPPSKAGVPGVPWQAWQASRSFFAASPWKAGLVGSRQTDPRGWGAAEPWQRVALKQVGTMPGEGGAAGLPGGLRGEPARWHWAQMGALEGSVVAWVQVAESFQGLGGCGAGTPWQLWQDTPEPSPPKVLPWQAWQEAMPPPVASWAAFARSP